MRNWFIFSLSLLFSLLLAACSVQAVQTVPTSTFTPTPNLPPDPPTPTRGRPTKTPTPSRTPAPTPTRTATPTATATYSLADLATIAVNKTDEAEWEIRQATEEVRFPGCTSDNRARSYSPDQKWVARVCMDVTGVYSLLDPTRYYLMKRGDYEIDGEKLFGYYFPVHWSGDGRYLYLSFYPQYGDGGCVDYTEGIILQRLDLVTGEKTTTLPGTNWQFYNFAFSQDDRYLAYFETWLDFPVLNIVNQMNSELQRIPIGAQYSEAGDMLWAPDNSYVIFSTRTGQECEEMVYYLILLKLDDRSQTTILSGADAFYRPLYFSPDNQVVVQHGYGYADYFSINLGTFLLTPYATPSPMPWPTLIP